MRRRRSRKQASNDTSAYVMGALRQKQKWHQSQNDEEKEKYQQVDVEKYFRPSRRSILNNRLFDYHFFNPYFGKTYSEISLPAFFLDTPENAILYYFSILQEAENLTEQLIGGCGTVGWAKTPFSIAYNFFTKDYKQKIPYTTYVASFEGVGHTNLIKLYKLPNQKADQPTRFFIEFETINGTATGVSAFEYYYGTISIQKEDGLYKIDNINLIGEDFLCAAYHGWRQQGENVVDIEYGGWCKLIKKRLPTKRDDYVKFIDIIGMNGNNYRFVFVQITNDTDVLVSQLIKRKQGSTWEETKIDPTKCVENKES
ncbi:hypothetical protein [Psychrobacillus lasiicapitis]|uniref:Uncharacterized protein n=1 Tax=Psychrobacillus lasiicapitis TaxID=1636719 RepID=A0A544T5J8_9BACI|nr:hypothetical protein [Psychrobacillus lasiicapitis]TQR12686.1 hypothetical protein FG382_12445 [Psychrobacillus lasiicapitis]